MKENYYIWTNSLFENAIFSKSGQIREVRWASSSYIAIGKRTEIARCPIGLGDENPLASNRRPQSVK
jgi:hypothetical protein